MATHFPVGVPDGTIYEVSVGSYYQYNARQNNWVKVDGPAISLELATPSNDGLMSSDDYIKLNDLLLPPPRTSLSNENCSYVFDSGVFGFRSSSNHLNIETELTLIDKDSKGFDKEVKNVWRIHDNTYGINFRLNLQKLITEMTSRGTLTYNKSIGPQGQKGLTGASGIDNLETGPKGDTGQDGVNAPFSGFLSQDPDGFLTGDANRAIVDVSVEEVSASENYLVLTRANLGDANFCPKFVRPKNLNSKWIVAIDERPHKRILVEECNPVICGTALCDTHISKAIIQSYCSTSLYYIDFSSIEQAIRDRYVYLLGELKSVKEEAASSVLKVMIDMFTEHKLALCCALENCVSRRENQRHRNIIDGERIQATQAGLGIIVDGEEYRNYVDTNPGEVCIEDATDALKEEQGTDNPTVVDGNKLIVNCGDNNSASSSVTMELEAGEYRVDVSTCCCFTSMGMMMDQYNAALNDPSRIAPSFKYIFEAMEPYNGICTISYVSAQGAAKLVVPNKGYFRQSEKAVEAYSGISFNIVHAGGLVGAYYSGGLYERNKFNGATVSITTASGVTKIPYNGSAVDSGTMDIVFTRTDVVEPATDEPFRENCEAGISVVGEIDISIASVQLSKTVISTTPIPFTTPSNVYDKQSGRPVAIELPSPGVYDVVISDGYIFNGTVVNAERAKFCVNGCTIKANDSDSVVSLPPGERIYPGWQVVSNKAVPAPVIVERFVSGYLVTKDMYDAVINNDVDGFHKALLGSKSLMGDPVYDGLENAVYPDVDVELSKLMGDIREQILAYTGVVSCVYNGYRTDTSDAETLIVSSPSAGEFNNSGDVVKAFVGMKFRVWVAVPVLYVFYNVGSEFGDFVQPVVSPNSGKVGFSVSCVGDEESTCASPVVSTNLSCRYRDRETNALKIELDAGEYVLTVSNCCCLTADGYSGRVAMKYAGPEGEELKLISPDLGSGAVEGSVSSMYVGTSFAFNHRGGDVKVWVPKSSRDGVIGIEIQYRSCLDDVSSVGTTGAVEDDEEYQRVIEGEPFYCDMTSEHINFYEASWIGRACCGAVVEAGGNKWIVVKKSVGTDISCGGGEYADSDCIMKGLSQGVHPAIAFPTVDGKTFIGKPTSGYQRLYRDINLEYLIITSIKSDNMISSVNNPNDSIVAIVFPYD